MATPPSKGTGLNPLTLWRDATRLLRLIEEAVRRFPRYHKYTLGSDLRRQAMGVCRLILRLAPPRIAPSPPFAPLAHQRERGWG